jgi:hypothetical protein
MTRTEQISANPHDGTLPELTQCARRFVEGGADHGLSTPAESAGAGVAEWLAARSS